MTMRLPSRGLAGFALLALGAFLVLAAGSALAADLFGDAYPDTILDHPRETGLVLVGLALSAAGVLLGRRGAPSGRRKPARVAVGALIVPVAGAFAYLYTILCGFGCSRGEYWAGLVLLALTAAAGIVLAARGPRATTDRAAARAPE